MKIIWLQNGVYNLAFLISTNKKLLEALQLKIHNHMIANVLNYNAEKWSSVIKHHNLDLFALLINNSDKRFPYNAITQSEKLDLVDRLPDGFLKSTKLRSLSDKVLRG